MYGKSWSFFIVLDFNSQGWEMGEDRQTTI